MAGERPVERVLEKLTGVTRRPGGWVATCPSHDPSAGVERLQVSERPDGSVGLFCHGGCETKRVLAALGLRMSDLFATPPAAGWRPRREAR
jgi:hypothetical protein